MSNTESNKLRPDALIQLSRVNGTTNLFGSEFEHPGYVALRICEARSNRSLSETTYSQGRQYIEVHLSYAQFAEAITTLNSGIGTTCTLYRLNGVYAEKVEPIKEEDIFRAEVSTTLEEFNSQLNYLQSEVDAASLSKAQRLVLNNRISSLRRIYTEKLPFIKDMFEEYVSKVTSKAKQDLFNWFEWSSRLLLRGNSATDAETDECIPGTDIERL